MDGMLIWVCVCAWLLTLVLAPVLWAFPTATCFLVTAMMLRQLVKRCEGEVDLAVAVEQKRLLMREVKNLNKLISEQCRQHRKILKNFGHPIKRAKSC
jgi:hypothetical protein